jgi:hypothetical protein
MKTEAALAAIAAALFPPPVRGEGDYPINSDACLNLQGVLIDLEQRSTDPVCIRTIRRVHQQLVEVKRILREAGFD